MHVNVCVIGIITYSVQSDQSASFVCSPIHHKASNQIAHLACYRLNLYQDYSSQGARRMPYGNVISRCDCCAESNLWGSWPHVFITRGNQTFKERRRNLSCSDHQCRIRGTPEPGQRVAKIMTRSFLISARM